MPASFKEGDVVVRMRAGTSVAAVSVIEAGTLGTICRVVTPGRSYKVRYADLPFCLTVFHGSIRHAPAGTAGPVCEPDC